MRTARFPAPAPPPAPDPASRGLHYLAAYARPRREPVALLETDSADQAAEWRTVQELLGRLVLREGETLPPDWFDEEFPRADR